MKRIYLIRITADSPIIIKYTNDSEVKLDKYILCDTAGDNMN